MNKHAAVAVVGGDARQAILAELMDQDGHTVSVGALERHSFNKHEHIRSIADLKTGLSEHNIIILPMPVQKGENQLNAPLSNASHLIGDLLDCIAPGTLVLAGAVPFAVHARAVRNHLRLTDYLTRDELAVRNAVPTAEGAIQIAMEQTDVTLHGLPVLVIGCGRIGSVLSAKLAALGAKVTVSARSCGDHARIEAAGLSAADTRRLSDVLGGFPLVFNTVPGAVLGAAELAKLPADALVIDLASQPGGIDLAAVPPAGIRIIHALSLPGKVAPVTASIAVRDTIYAILGEEGIL